MYSMRAFRFNVESAIKLQEIEYTLKLYEGVQDIRIFEEFILGSHPRIVYWCIKVGLNVCLDYNKELLIANLVND